MTFQFVGNDFGGSGIDYFRCKVNSGSWATCTSPYDFRANVVGVYTFYVYAYDNAGNNDPTPAQYTWTFLPPGTWCD